MKEVFATKDDLTRFATKDDFNTIKKELCLLNKRSKENDHVFDAIVSHHHKRLVQLEEHTGVKPPPYIPQFPSAN